MLTAGCGAVFSSQAYEGLIQRMKAQSEEVTARMSADIEAARQGEAIAGAQAAALQQQVQHLQQHMQQLRMQLQQHAANAFPPWQQSMSLASPASAVPMAVPVATQPQPVPVPVVAAPSAPPPVAVPEPDNSHGGNGNGDNDDDIVAAEAQAHAMALAQAQALATTLSSGAAAPASSTAATASTASTVPAASSGLVMARPPTVTLPRAAPESAPEDTDMAPPVDGTDEVASSSLSMQVSQPRMVTPNPVPLSPSPTSPSPSPSPIPVAVTTSTVDAEPVSPATHQQGSDAPPPPPPGPSPVSAASHGAVQGPPSVDGATTQGDDASGSANHNANSSESGVGNDGTSSDLGTQPPPQPRVSVLARLDAALAAAGLEQRPRARAPPGSAPPYAAATPASAALTGQRVLTPSSVAPQYAGLSTPSSAHGAQSSPHSIGPMIGGSNTSLTGFSTSVLDEYRARFEMMGSAAAGGSAAARAGFPTAHGGGFATPQQQATPAVGGLRALGDSDLLRRVAEQRALMQQRRQ